MRALLRLGRWRDDRPWQFLILFKAFGEVVTIKHAFATVIHRPDAGIGRPGHIVPHHHLDGQDLERLSDYDVWVGIRDHVVGADVRRLVKPEARRLVQDLPLERYSSQNMIKRGLPVRGDHDAPAIRQVV